MYCMVYGQLTVLGLYCRNVIQYIPVYMTELVL